jgi:hypothetical protein
MYLPPLIPPEGRKKIEFPKRCYLEFRTIDKVQKPSESGRNLRKHFYLIVAPELEESYFEACGVFSDDCLEQIVSNNGARHSIGHESKFLQIKYMVDGIPVHPDLQIWRVFGLPAQKFCYSSAVQRENKAKLLSLCLINWPTRHEFVFGSENIRLPFLTMWMWLFSFMARPLNPRRKRPLYRGPRTAWTL